MGSHDLSFVAAKVPRSEARGERREETGDGTEMRGETRGERREASVERNEERGERGEGTGERGRALYTLTSITRECGRVC